MIYGFEAAFFSWYFSNGFQASLAWGPTPFRRRGLFSSPLCPRQSRPILRQRCSSSFPAQPAPLYQRRSIYIDIDIESFVLLAPESESSFCAFFKGRVEWRP